ncbi:MAG TPA: non-canonical purine NTP phosphatase [Mariniphaga anaerophila]|uniref:Probable inosine/xanthosine triphosphatase n=1 Tax=Mariniphaga anaerophila TaxID=1484053 RepID=A0A831LPB3_9BACT|nr:non-canonical purine NTP phosphatase [Mariniphaga anaerophila]
MKIVIASENPVKMNAVKKGFRAFFRDIEAECITTSSGVSAQPLTDRETQLGARNRVAEARKRIHDADFWVGIEGGVQSEEKGLAAFAWIVIYSAGKTGEARTATFFLPPKVAHLVAGGFELGDANDLVFKESNSKQKNGAVGLLTHNAIDRTELYRQAVIMALIPFVNPGLY